MPKLTDGRLGYGIKADASIVTRGFFVSVRGSGIRRNIRGIMLSQELMVGWDGLFHVASGAIQ